MVLSPSDIFGLFVIVSTAVCVLVFVVFSIDGSQTMLLSSCIQPASVCEPSPSVTHAPLSDKSKSR
jgi:hypothetical protein